MFSIISSISSFKTFNQSYILYRYLRNASKCVTSVKELKDFKVKNVDDDYDFINVDEYNDMLKRVRQNDLDVEETFTKGEDIESPVSESGKLLDVNISEEKFRKSFIKKQLIGRKYFRSEKETNLLTYAAKEQLRYLHKLDSVEWGPGTLSKSFPISVAGVKKLLKSNYKLFTPEKIKEHDDEVRKRWEILKSGKPSDCISFYTQNLWNDGKLLRENYNGNPNLPEVPKITSPEVIEKKKTNLGEFSAIVQKYVEYKAQKDSTQNSQSELCVTSELNKIEFTNSNSKDENKILNQIKRKSKFIIDNDKNYTSKSTQDDDLQLPFSQFKENIISDLKFQKSKSSSDQQYQEWVKQQTEEKKFKNSKKPFITTEHFSPIPKYNKQNIEMNQDKSKGNNFYIYDDKLGYIHPKGKNVKRKIQVSERPQNKNLQYKVGNCVYDEEGELLYKLPS